MSDLDSVIEEHADRHFRMTGLPPRRVILGKKEHAELLKLLLPDRLHLTCSLPPSTRLQTSMGCLDIAATDEPSQLRVE